MNEISNRVLKTEDIQWRNAEWLQGNLKELSDKQFGKLKQSLIKNSFIMPFNVWQNGKLWILDGHHRQKAMLELEKEGHSIPDKLPANFIDCKDSKEAKKLVLIYSSIYARASEESLKEFITAADLNFDDLKLEIDLPDMNLGKFEREFMTAEVVEDKVPEVPKQARTVKGDLYELGKHRLLCGDSTNSDDVARLMDGKKADMVFTSPQYNAGNNSLGGNKNKVESKYESSPDSKSESEYLEILNSFVSTFLPFCDYLFVNIQMLAGNKRAVLSWLNLHSPMFVDVCVWVKGGGQPAMAKNVFNSRFEFVFIFRNQENPGRAIDIANFHGDISNVFELNPSGKNDFSKIHAATFPVAFVSHYIVLAGKSGLVVDPFSGTGSTLIAAEQTNRICYGMEIEPKYCDVIVSRYCNFTKQNKVKLNGKDIEWQIQ